MIGEFFEWEKTPRGTGTVQVGRKSIILKIEALQSASTCGIPYFFVFGRQF